MKQAHYKNAMILIGAVGYVILDAPILRIGGALGSVILDAPSLRSWREGVGLPSNCRQDSLCLSRQQPTIESYLKPQTLARWWGHNNPIVAH